MERELCRLLDWDLGLGLRELLELRTRLSGPPDLSRYSETIPLRPTSSSCRDSSGSGSHTDFVQ